MSITIIAPKKSPSLGEYGSAFIVDESGNQLPVEAVVFLDANGHSGLAEANQIGETSQVTGRQQAPLIGPSLLPTKALVGLDSSGNPIPLGQALAGAVKKFQSAVVVGTGASQNVAHTLGVVPSLVLVSAQDNTGAATFAIVEGAHTNANLLITATSGLKYKVIAFA